MNKASSQNQMLSETKSPPSLVLSSFLLPESLHNRRLSTLQANAASIARMDGAMQAIRPYQRRSAYQPTDSIAYLHPQELRCVRSEADELGPEVHLCSLCTEIALGEPLLDENEEQTEYCIAFYELPCGHLRWLVPV